MPELADNEEIKEDVGGTGLDSTTISEINDIIIKEVSKDVNNGFPLIINKSFSLINLEEIFGGKDTEKIEKAKKYMQKLQEQLTTEILDKSNEILQSI